VIQYGFRASSTRCLRTSTVGDVDYQIEGAEMDSISATYTLTLTLSGPDARGA
jgi:hypothetical protein